MSLIRKSGEHAPLACPRKRPASACAANRRARSPERGHPARSTSVNQQPTGFIDAGSICKPAAAWKAALRWIAAPLLLLFVSISGQIFAAEKPFTLSGVSLTLEDVSSEVEVRYRSIRLNRAQNVWNVEALLTNKSSRVIQGPFILLVESFTGTTGGQQTDGSDDSTPAKAFYDFSASVEDGALSPGEIVPERTLTLGVGTGAPSLVTKIFAAPNRGGVALGLVRSLNEVGQPLTSVHVEEIGPTGPTNSFTDPVFGVATVGQGSGAHLWKFSAPGYLPVWRQQALTTGEVAIIASPRLTRRGTNAATITLLDGAQVRDAVGAIQINFPAGAVTQNTTATLTPLTGQTLPALPPLGWSPLQAFWLELTGPLSTPVTTSLRPAGQIGSGETAALVRLNENTLQWEVVQLLPGDGTNSITATLNGGGAYALVVGDLAPIAPPVPQVGQTLQASSANLPDFALLTAIGQVNPSSSPASRVPELVTATAEVIISHPSNALPSGLVLRGEVLEAYRLSDRTGRHPPQYEHFVIGYQRPGDNNASTLHASFPLRPVFLFGSEELDEATVKVDVLTSAPFNGTVLDSRGGQVNADGLRVLAGNGDVAGNQAAQLRRLNPTNFLDLVPTNVPVVAAFDLTVAGISSGRRLVTQPGPLPTNGIFVLARVLYDQGQYGLQPLERVTTDALGRLATTEPVSGDRLDGIVGAGQYVLLQINARQALVNGVARNSAGQPTSGMPVRISGQPWLAFSKVDGSFELLAPTGSVDVAVTDPATGDTGQSTLVVTDPNATANTSLSSAAVGPQVVSINPTNNAVNVSRVTPIEIAFSEPVNPATLLGNAIQLLGTNGQAVTASLTLNLRNSGATLLPADQLEAGTRYTVQLSTNIADPAGLKLEGPRQFVFDTARNVARGELAKLTIFEPGATNIPANLLSQLVGFDPVTNRNSVVAHGSPGTAESEAPVILVNESSGETVTVLSKPDGSFTSFIRAAVEDLITAVFVNANGTRTTVPASEQRFDDGRVGLYHGGGTIEVAGADGPIHLLIEPGAIHSRSVFKIEALSSNQVAEATHNTPPENGVIVSSFRLQVEGEIPSGTGSAIFAVDPAKLNLPPGKNAEDAAFSLAVPQLVDGQTGFLVVDKMRYRDGKVSRNSFLGVLGFLAVAAAQEAIVNLVVLNYVLIIHGSDPVGVHGKVFEVDEQGGKHALAGAFVSATPLGVQSSVPGRLQAGALYSLSARDGSYGLVLPVEIGTVNPLSGFPGYLLAARHPRYAQAAIQSVALNSLLAAFEFGIFERDLIFPASSLFTLDSGASGIRMDVSVSPASAGTNEPVALTATAFSGIETPEIFFAVQQVASLVAGVDVQASDLVQGNPVNTEPGPNTARQVVSVRALKPLQALVRFRAIATTPEGNVLKEEKFMSLTIGGGGVNLPPDDQPADKEDTVGPSVYFSSPQDGDVLPPGGKITVRFSEPVNRNAFNQNDAVIIAPELGTKPGLHLSEDRQTLEITPGRIPPAVDEIVMSLNGPPIVDLATPGNPFDQDAGDDGNQPFSLTLKTKAPKITALGGLDNGGGVVAHGGFAYVLDRGAQPALKVFDIDSLLMGSAGPAAAVNLIGFPRDLALMPRWGYRPSLNGPAVTNDLLAVVGGNLGSSSVDESGNVFNHGQFLRVFDISNPTQPQRLLGALLTLRNTAVNRVLWRPPALIYVETGSDLQHVGVIDFQEMLVGFNATPGERASFPDEGFPGVQVNNDGDYVDANEEVPQPQKRPLEFFGKRFGFVLSGGGLIQDVDFDTSGYAGVVVGESISSSGATVRASYRTLMFGGSALAESDGVYLFQPGARPKRLTTLLNQPLQVDAQTTVNRSLALVTLSPDGDGKNKLVIVDITSPLTPTATEIVIPVELGLPQGITRREDGLLGLSTTTDSILLDPRLFLVPPQTEKLHPAIVGIIPGAGSGNRTLSQQASGLNLVALGGRNELVQAAPRLRFVSFPFSAQAVDPVTLHNGPPEAVESVLANQRLLQAVPIARIKTQGTVLSSVDPPSPAVHIHVLVDAPGAAGGTEGTIRVMLESLNEAGYPLKNKGRGFAPVRACSDTAVGQLGQQPRAETDAPIHEVKAYRLSAQKTSPLYNLYLSEPFVLAQERISFARLNELESNPLRRILWSGAFLRASLDPAEQGNIAIGSFATTIDSAQKVARPVAFVVAETQPAAYVVGNNPPPIGGEVFFPGTFGTINALNGEFRHSTVDVELPSPRMPIVFKRTIGGQDLHDGPFGPGWDFNYNQRLVELKPATFPPGNRKPLVIRSSPQESKIADSLDVQFVDGEGHVILFRYKGTNAPSEFSNDPLVTQLGWTTGEFYLPDANEKGVFDLLYRHRNREFTRLTPEGMQFWYAKDGRLTKLYDRYPKNSHVLVYNVERGELTRIIDKSVNEKRTLDIGYYRLSGDLQGDLDKQTSFPFVAGRIHALKDYAGRITTFEYTEAGVLQKRLGPETSSGLNGFSGMPTSIYLYKSPVFGQIQGIIVGNGASTGGGNAGTALFAANMTTTDEDKAVATQGALPPGGGGSGQVGINVPQGNSAATTDSQTTSSQTPDSSSTEYTFDGQGFVKAVRKSGPGAGVNTESNAEAKTETHYNSLGLLDFIKYPEGNSATFTYDVNNAALRARKNLLSAVVAPGTRGGGTHTAAWTDYDFRYNLPGGMTDFKGNLIGYTRVNEARDIGNITYPGAGVHRRTFSADKGQLEFEETPDGITLNYGYDQNNGFLTSLARGNQPPTEYGYQPAAGSVAHKLGQPTQVTLPHGPQLSLEYDNRLLLTKTTRGGLVENRGYDENGNLAYLDRTVGGGAPYIERHQYNQVNFLENSTVVNADLGGGADDLITVFEPDPAFRVKKMTFPEGEIREFTYDHLDNVVKIKTGDFSVEYSRDRHGNIREIRESGELSRLFVYDGHDRLIQENRFGEQLEIVSRTYHENGELKTLKATAGAATVQDIEIPTVDALGRPTLRNFKGQNAPTGSQTITYAQGGGLTTTIIGPKDTVTTTTDSAGRLKTQQENAIGTTTYTIDDGNNLKDVSSAEDGVTYSVHRDYNPLDHLTLQSDPEGTQFTQTPRLDGLPTSITDGRSKITGQTFSQLGQLLSQNRPESIAFNYKFDRNGRPTYVGDPSKGNGMEYTDGRLRLTKLTLPTSDAFAFNDPDKRNLPQTITLPGGGSRNRTYDRLGRMLSESSAFGGQTYAQTDIKYDTLDRVRSVNYQTGNGSPNSATYIYDSLGPLTSVTFSESGGPFGLAYGIREDGERTSVTYPGGPTVGEARDNAGRLTSVTANGPVCEITLYAGSAQPKTITHGGIIKEENDYDGRRRLKSRRYLRTSDNKVLAEMAYTYDAADNVIVRNYLHLGRADIFEYDNASRLTKAGIGARPAIAGAEDQVFPDFPLGTSGLRPGIYARTYTYDGGGHDFLTDTVTQNPRGFPAGNTGFTVPPFATTMGGDDAFHFAGTVDGLNRFRDEMGNTETAFVFVRPTNQTDSVFSIADPITYNALSFLVELRRPADNVTISYEYQPGGLMHRRTVKNGSTTVSDTALVWDEGRLIQEHDLQAGNLRARYFYAGGDTPTAAEIRDQSGSFQKFYYLRDHNFSIIGVVDTSGAVVERASYDAWGQPVIEKQDVLPPQVGRILELANGEILVAFSELILPLPGASGFSGAIEVNGQSVSLTYVETAANQPFGATLRAVLPNGTTGSFTLRVRPGALQDTWGNINAEETLALSLTGTSGAQLFPPGAPVTSTAPERTARSVIGNPFLFHGQYFDYDAGLAYMRARFYDPYTGSFLQRDPEQYAESVNLYAAFRHNPTSTRDPLGTVSIIKGALAIGKAVAPTLAKAVAKKAPPAAGGVAIRQAPEMVGYVYRGMALEPPTVVARLQSELAHGHLLSSAAREFGDDAATAEFFSGLHYREMRRRIAAGEWFEGFEPNFLNQLTRGELAAVSEVGAVREAGELAHLPYMAVSTAQDYVTAQGVRHSGFDFAAQWALRRSGGAREAWVIKARVQPGQGISRIGPQGRPLNLDEGFERKFWRTMQFEEAEIYHLMPPQQPGGRFIETLMHTVRRNPAGGFDIIP